MAHPQLNIGQHVYWEPKQVLGRITRVVTSSGCGPGNDAPTEPGTKYPVHSYYIENLITGNTQFYSFAVPWKQITETEANDIRDEMAATLLTAPAVEPDTARTLLDAYAQTRANYASGVGTWAAVERAAYDLRNADRIQRRQTRRARIAAEIVALRQRERAERQRIAAAKARTASRRIDTSPRKDEQGDDTLSASAGLTNPRANKSRVSVVLTRDTTPVSSDQSGDAA